jgi:hypothetical protein
MVKKKKTQARILKELRTELRYWQMIIYMSLRANAAIAEHPAREATPRHQGGPLIMTGLVEALGLLPLRYAPGMLRDRPEFVCPEEHRQTNSVLATT